MSKKVTSKGKRAAQTFGQPMGQERMTEIYPDIFKRGESALDSVVWEMGQLLVESIIYLDRKTLAGPKFFSLLERAIGSKAGS